MASDQRGAQERRGLLLQKLHTWADAGCQQRLSCGRSLWEGCISVVMEHLWQAALRCFLELSHRSFLGARGENSTVFQNSWPLGDETPPAWIIKAQRELSEKSTLSSAWGRRSLLESTLRSLGSSSRLAEYAQSSSSPVGWDAEMQTLCPQGSLFVCHQLSVQMILTVLVWNNKEQGRDTVMASYMWSHSCALCGQCLATKRW